MKVFRHILIALLFAAAPAWAQYGFGTNNPNPSSILELSSPDKGLLVPRLSLSVSNTLAPVTGTASTSHNGLLIYNTNTATNTGLSGVGFYYWQGGNTGSWVQLQSYGNQPFFGTDDQRAATENTENIYTLGNVGVGTSTLDASAALQVESTTQGFLPPRMTEAQRDAIASPATGIIVYCTDCGTLQMYNGATWSNLTNPLAPATGSLGGSGGACAPITVNGTFEKGVPVVAGMTATVQINVTTIGTYNITTPQVNGYYFTASGETNTTGAQNIVLQAVGTPSLSGQTDVFTASFGGTNCTFNVPVASPASMLTDIGTDANNGNNNNTASLTAADLNGFASVSGASVANEALYRAAIAANDPSMTNPTATEAEVQAMVTAVNNASSTLANIGTDAANGNNTNTGALDAATLNGLPAVSGATVANEPNYRYAIATNSPTLSSPATLDEVQAMVTAVNNAGTLLGNIGTDASNGNNANTGSLSAGDLNGLPGISGATAGNEANYRYAIKTNTPTLSNPATLPQVQAMIDAVNNADGLLASIGTDAANGNNSNTNTLTIADLNGIPGVSGATAGNLAAYQAAIAANDPALSNPATAEEVQALVTAVNNAAPLLSNIGTDASNLDNSNTSTLTAADLNGIPGVSGATAGNEANYKHAIATNSPTLNNPATAAEVQAMVTAVNNAGGLLASIGTDAANGATSLTTTLTAADLNVLPGISGATAGNEANYKTAIAANDPAFSSPATLAEVQSMITSVTNAAGLLASIGTDAANGNNSNTGTLTVADLNNLPGVSGATAGNLALYQVTIAANDPAMSSPATLAEIQAMINAANEDAGLLANIGTDRANTDNSNTSTLTASDLNGIFGVSGAIAGNEAAYKTRIATANAIIPLSSPATVAEVNALIGYVEIVEDIAGNSNTVSVTAAQLNDISGVSSAVNGVDYASHLANGTFVDANNPTAAEIQTVITDANNGQAIAAVDKSAYPASGGTLTLADLTNLGLAATANNLPMYSAEMATNSPTPATLAELEAIVADINTAATTSGNVTSTTGKIWMDRNLGASRVAQNSTDTLAYGDLYQWGRNSDGHESRTSSVAAGPVASGSEGSNFITNGTSPFDWLSTQDETRWNGATKGAHDPCPTGFRVPTETELENERLLFPTNNAAGAFNSVLKLPVAGYRTNSAAALTNVGSFGHYWSSTVVGTNARPLVFNSSNAFWLSNYRAYGFSVRCLKE